MRAGVWKKEESCRDEGDPPGTATAAFDGPRRSRIRQTSAGLRATEGWLVHGARMPIVEPSCATRVRRFHVQRPSCRMIGQPVARETRRRSFDDSTRTARQLSRERRRCGGWLIVGRRCSSGRPASRGKLVPRETASAVQAPPPQVGCPAWASAITHWLPRLFPVVASRSSKLVRGDTDARFHVKPKATRSCCETLQFLVRSARPPALLWARCTGMLSRRRGTTRGAELRV